VSPTSRNANIGLPGLSLVSSSNSKQGSNVSFADRFKNRDQGLFGMMPSQSTFSSFLSGPAPSYLNNPSPPGPPPDLKAVSQPRQSPRKSSRNTLSPTTVFRNESIDSDLIPADISNEKGLLFTNTLPNPPQFKEKKPPRRPPASSCSVILGTPKSPQKSSVKRKGRRSGLPKRPKGVNNPGSPSCTSKIRNRVAAINQNIATEVESGKRKEGVKSVVSAKVASPPPFNVRPQQSELSSNDSPKKPGPPPVPIRKRSKTLSSKPSKEKIRVRKRPNPPISSFKKHSGNLAPSENEVSDSKSIKPLSNSTGKCTSEKRDIKTLINVQHNGRACSSRSQFEGSKQESSDRASQPPGTSTSGSACRNPQERVAQSVKRISDDEKEYVIQPESDDAIVKRRDRVLEICRELNRGQNGTVGEILDSVTHLNGINQSLQTMLERNKIPRNISSEKLQSIFKQLEGHRLRYLGELRCVTNFLQDLLHSSDTISPSFVTDEEKEYIEEDTQKVYAKFPYKGGVRTDAELIFDGGEIIEVFEEYRGWCRGRVFGTIEQGWFPTSYVAELPESYFTEEEVE